MKVLGRVSSLNVRKVLWTFAELGLEPEREDWGMGFRDVTDPGFVALNPNAQIPVLIDGDFVLWESNAIIRYLCNAHGGANLYPSDARARARIDQWIDWQATELNASWVYAFQALVRKSPSHNDPGLIARSVAQWTHMMTLLNDQLAKTGGHVTGADFTLADVPVGLSAMRWFATPLDHKPLPAVDAYVERLKQRAGFTAYGPGFS
jgi:glutathione S-transferase